MQTKEPENEGTGHQIPIRRTNRRELLLLRRRPPLLILRNISFFPSYLQGHLPRKIMKYHERRTFGGVQK